jgi:hypothetical protein
MQSPYFDYWFFDTFALHLMTKVKKREIFDAQPQELGSKKLPLKAGWATIIRLLCQQIRYPCMLVNESGEASPDEVNKFLREAEGLIGIASKFYSK